MPKAKPEHLAGINRFAKEPLTADEAYVHKFRMIGTRFMPSRCLQIDESLLPIYKAFIDNGDVVQIADHSFGGWNNGITMPFGRYFASEIVTDSNGVKQLDGLMYMKAGQKTYVSDFTTDDINSQLDSGILSDSSVSIGWGKSQCSICGNDIRDYENCPHWPGETYKVNGVDMLCFIIAKPADPGMVDRSIMIENSLVCAGAYPDAGHIPLSLSMQGNQQTEQEQGYQELNNMADLKLVKQDAPVFCLFSSNDAKVLVEPGSKRSAAESHSLYHQLYQGLSDNGSLPNGWTMTKLVASHTEAVKELSTSNQQHELKDALDGTLPAGLKKLSKGSDHVELQQIVRTALGLGADAEITPEAIAGALSAAKLSVETSVRTALGIKPEAVLSESLASVVKDAEQGRQYRLDVIETALASGTRDQGNDFKTETFKKMFDALSIDEIKAMGASWETSAVVKLGLVRHSDDGTPELPEKGEALNHDDECYSMKK